MRKKWMTKKEIKTLVESMYKAKLVKMYIPFVLFAFFSLILVACGGDSGTDSETVRKAEQQVNTSFELGACVPSRNGESVFVREENVSYVCANENWIKLENESEYSSSSNFAQKPVWAYLNPNVNYGTFTDLRDSQVYKTVTIGSQIWMAENLNYNYNVGSARSVCYNENNYTYSLIDSCSIFGRLYTWAAAIDSVGLFSGNAMGCGDGKVCTAAKPVQGVCPDGWHLPSLDEWKTLGYIVAEDANKLKSTKGWHISDDFATNYNGSDDYGFSSLPAGIPIYGGSEKFDNAGYMTDYWGADTVRGNSMQGNYAFSTCVSIHYNSNLEYGQCARKNAISVRCVKNNDGISSSPVVVSEEDSQFSSSKTKNTTNSLYIARSESNACKGIMSWHGPDKIYRVDTKRDAQLGQSKCSTSFSAGCWDSYNDSENGGSSFVTWPASVVTYPYGHGAGITEGFYIDENDYSPLIDYCGGICGTYTLGLNEGDLGGRGSPFVGVGFSITGVVGFDITGKSSADVSDWGGICITYVSDIDLSIQEQYEDYSCLEVILPKASIPTTKKILWNSFKPTLYARNSTLTGEEAAKQLRGIMIEIRGNAGSSGNFNIISIGSYN